MNDNLFPIVGYGMIGGFDHIHTQRGADCDDWSEKTPHGKLLLEDFLHLMVFHNRNECFFLFYSRLTQCLALQWLIQWSTPWQTSWLTPWIAPFRENSMFAQHIIDCEFPRYDDGIGEEGQKRLRYTYQGISITKNYILLSDTHFSRNGPF